MSERVKKEKVESFINEAFGLSCLFTKNMVLVRYQTNRRSLFQRNRKLVNCEEFRDTVFKEFEDGIGKLHIDVSEDLVNTVRNVVDDIKRGKRPKLQRMIDNAYRQLLRESQTK